MLVLKRNMMRHKRLSLLLCLSLGACAKIPVEPDVWLCGYSVKFDRFSCVHTESKEQVELKRDDPIMEAAQCIQPNAFNEYMSWVSQVKKVAERKCGP